MDGGLVTEPEACLLVEERDDRVVLLLHRPEARNAIDSQIVAALHRACETLERTPKVAIITGGHGIFAAGADIRELRERRNSDALAGINSGVFDRIARLPMPTIAAVGGPAIGGGAELAYACDFRIGTTAAKFANPESGLGIAAAAGATWRLPELIGMARAKEVLLAGRKIDAERALELGLLSDLVAEDQLYTAAHELTDRILTNGALATRLTKALLSAPRSAHPAIDDVAQAVLFETDDKIRRMDAFLHSTSKPRLAEGR